jgi:hypothetical protein
MTPEAHVYTQFLAVRNHFTKEDYDYFFYRGRTRATPKSFERNKNYQQFRALSKHVAEKDVAEFLACNFARGRKWITDMMTHDAKEQFKQYRAYIESASYRFEEDLKLILPLSETVEANRGGTYPVVVTAAMGGTIALETLALLDRLSQHQLGKYWNSAIKEPFLWPGFAMRLRKYEPFIQVENEKLKIVLDRYTAPK